MRFRRQTLTIPQKGHRKRIQKRAETNVAKARKLEAECRAAVAAVLKGAGFTEEVFAEAVQDAVAAMPIGYWIFNKGRLDQ